MKPKVRLNIHRVDGTPLIADLALRDWPIAKDNDSIYVAAFGNGRNNANNRAVELDRIQILDGNNLNKRLTVQ